MNHPKELLERNFPTADQDVRHAGKQPSRYAGEDSSYDLAFADPEFLLNPELRPVRMQLELLKPEMVQRAEQRAERAEGEGQADAEAAQGGVGEEQALEGREHGPQRGHLLRDRLDMLVPQGRADHLGPQLVKDAATGEQAREHGRSVGVPGDHRYRAVAAQLGEQPQAVRPRGSARHQVPVMKRSPAPMTPIRVCQKPTAVCTAVLCNCMTSRFSGSA